MSPSKRLTNKEFFRVMKRSGGRCWYCGLKIFPNTASASPVNNVTIDHLIPVSAGGSDDLDNLVACCRTCNSAKCDRDLEWFRHVVAIRVIGMPLFTREQIAWIRKAGGDLSKYDGFKFWFESHRTRHTRPLDCDTISKENSEIGYATRGL
jgi:hypothetical protein